MTGLCNFKLRFLNENIKKLYSEFSDSLEKQNALWAQSLNLIASENVFSPTIGRILSSDIGSRIVEGPKGNRFFPGTEFYERIEEIGLESCKKLFRCDDVELRPISGSLANLISYKALLPDGATIMSLSLANGGHASNCGKIISILGYKAKNLPFSSATLNIDLEKAVQVLKEEKPALLILGGSTSVFPQPIYELVEEAKKIDCIVLFDAAHVIGLIAGNQYPNPIELGVDLMTFTLCKTIAGPQHAFIVGKKKIMEKVKKMSAHFHSGHHLHETAAGIYSLIEMLNFGEKYALQTINNSKALAKELFDLGFKVISNDEGLFTSTHLFLVDVRKYGGGTLVEKKLARSGIHINRNTLLGESTESFSFPSGIRIGTPEVTSIGMKEQDMKQIAFFFHEILNLDKVEESKERVFNFKKQFDKMEYTFDYD